jgi:hypothetical protein
MDDESASTDPDGAGEGVEPSEEDPDAVVEDVEQTPAYLIVGDRDHTEAFVGCLDSTGYTEPEYKQDPKEELREKQRTLEATTAWIKCARENGQPDLKDPPAPVADEWQTNPTALLPADISEAELRALLAVCPNFDEEQTVAHDEEWEKEYREDMSMAEVNDLVDKLAAKYPLTWSPSIGFDVPGYRNSADWEGYEELSDADRERLDALQQVMQEASQAYYDKISAEDEAAEG